MATDLLSVIIEVNVTDIKYIFLNERKQHIELWGIT